MKKTRFAAILCAVITAGAMLTGCNSDSKNTPTETSEVSQTETSSADATAVPEDEEDPFGELETMATDLFEGDDYAINKIKNKSPDDSIPGGYTLNQVIENYEGQQGKLFANGKSQIVIRAFNYKEYLQALDIWADQACAITKVANITKACDTNYDEPEKTKIMGFDAIKYNYEIIQYEFVDDPDNPEGEQIKKPRGTYKGIAYYFYSEQDAYAIMFDTAEANWEEQSANFEAFMNDLEVIPTEYKK